jgi:membrane protein involved in colicin uptake
MSSLPEDQKFRRITLMVLVAFLVASLAITIAKLPKLDRLSAPKTPPRVVKLIKPEVKKPKPPEVTKEQEEALRKAEEERRKRDEDERRKREEEDKRLAEQRKKELEEQRKLDEQRKKERDEQRKLADQQRQKELEELRKKQEEERKRLAEQRAKQEAERRAQAEAQRVEREKAAARKAAQDVFGGLGDSIGTTSSSLTTTNSPLTAAAAANQAAAPRGPSKTLSSSTATAGRGSSGIDTGKLASVDTGVGATIGTHSATAVEEIDLGIGGGGAGGGSDSEATSKNSGKPSRTARELNEIMERYKGRMAQIYQRALRKDPTLGGKLVAKITILPSGEVSAVDLSGDVNDSDLLARLRSLIMTINFGAKDVPTVEARYPIDFAML